MNRKNVQFKKYILHCQNDIGNEIRCVGDKKFWLHFRPQYLTSIILVLVWFQFHSEIVIHSKCQTSRIVIHHPLTLAIKIQMVHMHFKIDIITHVTCGMFQLCWFKTFDINMKIFSAEPFWPKLFYNIPFSFLLFNRWSLKICRCIFRRLFPNILDLLNWYHVRKMQFISYQWIIKSISKHGFCTLTTLDPYFTKF